MIHGKTITDGVAIALFMLALFGSICLYGIGVEIGLWKRWDPPKIQQQQQQEQNPQGEYNG